MLILDNNGGYDPIVTPSEFPDSAAIQRHLKRLAEPGPLNLQDAPPYYQRLNFAPLLQSGKAALVNAVAYRSTNSISQGVREIAGLLPSARVHREWLRDVAIPAAKKGDRLLVIHRWSLWGMKKQEVTGESIIWSPAPVGSNLTKMELTAIRDRVGG